MIASSPNKQRRGLKAKPHRKPRTLKFHDQSTRITFSRLKTLLLYPQVNLFKAPPLVADLASKFGVFVK